jgi:hypothetical protein
MGRKRHKPEEIVAKLLCSCASFNRTRRDSRANHLAHQAIMLSLVIRDKRWSRRCKDGSMETTEKNRQSLCPLRAKLRDHSEYPLSGDKW